MLSIPIALEVSSLVSSEKTSESEIDVSLIRESTDGSSSIVGRTKELRVKIEQKQLLKRDALAESVVAERKSKYINGGRQCFDERE